MTGSFVGVFVDFFHVVVTIHYSPPNSAQLPGHSPTPKQQPAGGIADRTQKIQRPPALAASSSRAASAPLFASKASDCTLSPAPRGVFL
jgi:hypothetical protein